MATLESKTCVPCSEGVPPLKGAELAELAGKVKSWEVVDGHHLKKAVRFPDFRQALRFVNQAGEIAEEQGHHPSPSRHTFKSPMSLPFLTMI
jgi:4a-hydroxytetrahydrobiopterin dehydratase